MGIFGHLKKKDFRVKTMYSLFKNTMSQYNNGNHINNIPVIPDYMDQRNDDGTPVSSSSTSSSEDGSYIKITKNDDVEEQENQNLLSVRFRMNGSMITTIDETGEEQDDGEDGEADGEKEPARNDEDVEDNDEEHEEEDVLNSDDMDEVESVTKIYVISVNNIPYYYEVSLKEARQQMLNLANHFAASLNEKNGPGHIYVTDHNLKRVKVIAPYNFLMLTYNHVMYEISLEYAIKL